MSTIKLKGSSSGEAEVTVAAAAGTPTFTLPTTVGSANQFVKNSGTAGTLEYSSNLTFDGNKLFHTPAANSNADGFHITPAGGTTASSFYVLGNSSSGAASGRNGGVTAIDANYYAASSTIFSVSGRGSSRFAINGTGNVNINNTGDLDAYRLAGAGSSVRGHLFRADGNSASTVSGQQFITGNRLDSDGNLVTFSQDGTQEGSITVSGSTVGYNGGHLSRWSQIKGLSQTDKSARPTIYQGTVMSNLDDLCEWEGEENQQLNMTKVSDVDGDKDVAGVFWAWDDDDDTIVNDFYIAMTGDLVIRVAASTTIARGDLLISAGDGTAKPQADDIIRSSTIAKVISTNSTATYGDGSKAYPCVLMAC